MVSVHTNYVLVESYWVKLDMSPRNPWDSNFGQLRGTHTTRCCQDICLLTRHKTSDSNHRHPMPQDATQSNPSKAIGFRGSSRVMGECDVAIGGAGVHCTRVCLRGMSMQE